MKILLVIKKLIYVFAIASLIVHIILVEGYGYTSELFLVRFTLGCFLFGIIGAGPFACITFIYAGTPNNYIQEGVFLMFDYRKIISEKNIIKVNEIEEGIWKVDDKYKSMIDMRGWIRQKKYLYELIASKLVLDSFNNGRQSALSLPFGGQKSKLKKLFIKFIDINGKTTYYQVIKNYVIRKTFYMRLRFFAALRYFVLGEKGSNYNHNNMYLRECFRLKLLR